MPGVQVHTHFALSARQKITGKIDIGGIARHLVIGQPGRFKTIFLAERLKTRQKTDVMRRDLAATVAPQVIAFSIERN